MGLALSCQQEEPTQHSTAHVEDHSHEEPAQSAPEHTDHTARHGGFFFMALDNHHHLEGTLQSPSRFRVYFYDSRTQPLDSQALEGIEATVFRGLFPDPPGTLLTASSEKGALEANLEGVTFPFALTLLVRFPDSPPHAKPELFTFEFREYSSQDTY